jgi:hypothetical protein
MAHRATPAEGVSGLQERLDFEALPVIASDAPSGQAHELAGDMTDDGWIFSLGYRCLGVNVWDINEEIVVTSEVCKPDEDEICFVGAASPAVADIEVRCEVSDVNEGPRE